MSEHQAWIDQHGDVWREGDDGLMHTRETAPFPREHVERKWGPLQLVEPIVVRVGTEGPANARMKDYWLVQGAVFEDTFIGPLTVEQSLKAELLTELENTVDAELAAQVLHGTGTPLETTT